MLLYCTKLLPLVSKISKILTSSFNFTRRLFQLITLFKVGVSEILQKKKKKKCLFIVDNINITITLAQGAIDRQYKFKEFFGFCFPLYNGIIMLCFIAASMYIFCIMLLNIHTDAIRIR